MVRQEPCVKKEGSHGNDAHIDQLLSAKLQSQGGATEQILPQDSQGNPKSKTPSISPASTLLKGWLKPPCLY